MDATKAKAAEDKLKKAEEAEKKKNFEDLMKRRFFFN